MFEKIICFLMGHRWHLYPENTAFYDYKVCDRCDKSIALSPYLTQGEIDYIDRMFAEALKANLIGRSSWFNKNYERE